MDARLIDPRNITDDGVWKALDASGVTMQATTLTSANDTEGNPRTRSAMAFATR